MKRGVKDSDNYFRETFIPLLKKKDTLITSDGDSENESNSSFDNYLISNPKLQRYDKSYGMHYDSVNDQLKISVIPVTFDHVYLKADGKPKTSRYFKWMNVVKPLYDRMKIDEKQLNEEVLKINNTKVKTPSQLKLKEFDNFLSSSGAKRRNIINDTAIPNEQFDFSSSVISSKFEEHPTDQLFKFIKKGSGLYKDVIPHTQLVYAGNTGVNNEIISIIEELQGLANELHRPARKVFPRRSILTRFKDDLWQADLMDMQFHSKQNLDTYTKYVWVESLENKTGKECTKGMFNILKQANPKLLQTDNGTEFYNNQFQQFMKKNKIRHYSTYSVIKCSIEERINKCTPYEARINTRYTPNWTTEIFTVSKVLHTEPITYQLKDGSNNIILGGFYEQEIKLTDFPNTFLIERIIKKVKDKMLVKWMGFDSNSVEKTFFIDSLKHTSLLILVHSSIYEAIHLLCENLIAR
ncbi:hypothetical protein AGLY_017209 [Aphis glycines]|uniref:Integrase catalytic domain-containing protein n=1 Tax=Aphis glycines TaxID=307491 RepID=A0A6G0SW45_APHGL|nr:hypothetical protein AGLY_017209 [Aphis glycines]